MRAPYRYTKPRPRPPRTVLTPGRVWEILDALDAGESQTAVARRHGVSRSAIWWIFAGLCWKDVLTAWNAARAARAATCTP